MSLGVHVKWFSINKCRIHSYWAIESNESLFKFAWHLPTTLLTKVNRDCFWATIWEYLEPPSAQPPTATMNLTSGWVFRRAVKLLNPFFSTSSYNWEIILMKQVNDEMKILLHKMEKRRQSGANHLYGYKIVLDRKSLL